MRFSVSVDRHTKKLLRDLADRAYQGNLSALITHVAQQAARQDAARALLQSHGRDPMTDAECEKFEAAVAAELAKQRPRKRKRRRAA